ncbi:MAG: AraC family transcriptional regulator [Bacteroidia bacterium]|nr:AraC family transcriptional regulator [Bacteroidia bacterium]
MLHSAAYQHLGFEAQNNLVRAFYLEVPDFGFHWHYHPELEITFIQNGRGTRLVGDNMNAFESEDFIFMGSNLPHTWISDDDFNKSSEMMQVAVLQFHPSVFPDNLILSQEMKSIRNLLMHSGRGIEIGKEMRVEASKLLLEMLGAREFDRYRLFLTLLDYLGREQEFKLLASQAYITPLNHATEKRILDVCRFVHEQFMNPIKLDQVAQLASMNPTSFCRFFKKSTGQSLSDYINDLRIGKACNLLMDKRKLSMSDIAFLSGFQSQTLFNRIFLKKKGMTPSSFRKAMG